MTQTVAYYANFLRHMLLPKIMKIGSRIKKAIAKIKRVYIFETQCITSVVQLINQSKSNYLTYNQKNWQEASVVYCTYTELKGEWKN